MSYSALADMEHCEVSFISDGSMSITVLGTDVDTSAVFVQPSPQLSATSRICVFAVIRSALLHNGSLFCVYWDPSAEKSIKVWT